MNLVVFIKAMADLGVIPYTHLHIICLTNSLTDVCHIICLINLSFRVKKII